MKQLHVNILSVFLICIMKSAMLQTAQWSKWAVQSCSATCGGVRLKKRTCKSGKIGDPGCEIGGDKFLQICGEPCWSEFSSWSDCSQTCGDGKQYKTRHCLNGKPGEGLCTGPEIIEKNYSLGCCPSWNINQTISSCSATCGQGVQLVNRQCLCNMDLDNRCKGNSTIEINCEEHDCLDIDVSVKTTNPESCFQQNCAQLCTPGTSNTVAKCSCSSGYRLSEDERSCSDVNECEENQMICSNSSSGPICINTIGSYTCTACSSLNNSFASYYDRNQCCLRNLSNNCGKSSSNFGRIVGGTQTNSDRWPWQAMFLFFNLTFCGGSLITTKHVLSAAHCFREFLNTSFINIIQVRLGDDDTETTSIHEQTFTVNKIYLHHNFNPTSLENDVAIIELDRDAVISDYVGTVCLPDGEEPNPGDRCYATGFGTIGTNLPSSTTLQEVDLLIVNRSQCLPRINTDLQLCAGFSEGGKDTCQGDSGGPLVCQRCDSCDWYIAGITSGGVGCGVQDFFGFYVRVIYYQSWITNITHQSNMHEVCEKPGWSKWSEWSICSVTCDSGTRSRERVCNNGAIGFPGCLGLEAEKEECYRQRCPYWGEWAVGQCNSTGCSIGVWMRERVCLNGNPGDGTCLGPATDFQECIADGCPTWSLWGEWSSCTKSCGSGQQTRKRTCTNGNPGDEGCEGEMQSTQSCNSMICPNTCSCDNGMLSCCCIATNYERCLKNQEGSCTDLMVSPNCSNYGECSPLKSQTVSDSSQCNGSGFPSCSNQRTCFIFEKFNCTINNVCINTVSNTEVSNSGVSNMLGRGNSIMLAISLLLNFTIKHVFRII